jgi:hypothetical protein
MDEEPQGPKPNFHPTIFHVRLEAGPTARWEASPRYRAEMLASWRRKAKIVGKRKIEVWGKYCRLGEFDTEEGDHVQPG